MKVNIGLVVVLAFLCVDTVFSRPPHPISANQGPLQKAARGLEKRLKAVGGRRHHHHTKGLVQQTHATTHKAHGRHVREMEEADNQAIFAAAAADDINEDHTTEEEAKAEEAAQQKKMLTFLALCFVSIVIFGFIGWRVAILNNPDLSVLDYFGLSNSKWIAVFVGMSSGLVFGFIDNLGLFFGMEYLDPFFAKLPNGDEEKVNAGYGNTFSDMIGAFLGTFAGSIIKDLAVKFASYSEADEYPIWSEAVGITVGCIIGVLLPRAILGDPKVKRLTVAQAEALANGVTQEQIDEVMHAFDRLDKLDPTNPGRVKIDLLKDATPGSIDKFILQADAAGDNDGWVTREEIMELLNKANKRFRSAQANIINRQDQSTTDAGVAKD